LTEPMKPVAFCGSALDDLRGFPNAPRREAGFQLDLVQNGRDPDDWKPMKAIGQGVREIRIRDEAGAFRVIYVAKFADAVFVLHCFEKKSQRTGRQDADDAVHFVDGGGIDAGDAAVGHRARVKAREYHAVCAKIFRVTRFARDFP